MSRAITLPAEAAGLHIVASVSGGKDSTAMILALREAGIGARYAFADTGWEAPETYEYIGYLRQKIGIVIDVVAVGDDSYENMASLPSSTYGAMVKRVRHRAGLPWQDAAVVHTRAQPLRRYHDRLIEMTGIETVSVMGVRATESESRAKMVEWEDEPEGPRLWGGYVWRPLLQWTIEDVLTIHNRHGVKVNPLYQRGHSRVGCYPCIYASKEEIRLVAQHAPERIDEIRALENADEATFFQTQRKGFGGIDAVVKWARTDHGGRQFPLFAPAPRGGCMQWGICDMPAEPDDK
jgi:3'-phosphoadenosine 5'-phosphosulfate sulfotransferase (PAPS reductase)/FAD synthetase